MGKNERDIETALAGMDLEGKNRLLHGLLQHVQAKHEKQTKILLGIIAGLSATLVGTTALQVVAWFM